MTGATIRDVARLASVSVASVSRTLNGAANVHPETRARVLAAVDDLGYVPHAGARSLSLSRTHAIGVVLPDLHSEFFSEMIRGMDREASARGYHLLLSNIQPDTDHALKALRAMRGRIDGLVLMAPNVDPLALAAMLPSNMPTVTINTHVETTEGRLRVDNRAGATAMIRHLIEQGRRRIVHVAGPAVNSDARERLEGCSAALPAQVELRVAHGDFTEQSGADAINRMLADNVPFDGVFAANDMMALGVLHALRAAGRRVPADVAVGGFDDVPLARYLSLTTMRVQMADMGARAAAHLIETLVGEAGTPVDETIVPALVVRGTSVLE